MELYSYVLLSVGSLFAILNPLGTVPTFMALTEGSGADDRVSMARRACLVAFFVMSTFSLLGARILSSFRVGIPALQIAGGLVILRVGLEMLGGRRPRLTPEEHAEAIEKDDVAITPLGVPLLCGPGSITTGIVLESQATGPLQTTILVCGEALTYALTFVLLWLAARYSVLIGQITMRVLGRLMGLLLAAVAIQFILNGLGDVVPQMLGPH
jgi:multiple antibiotic resistance protein